jgi:hypothetical protein
MMTLIVPVLTLLSVSANAEDTARYALEKTSDGYVRMDKLTGEMSICNVNGDQLVCRIAADDRVAMEDEIARIDGRLAKVEEKIADMKQSGLTSDQRMPADEEFEKTMGYMEKFFRRFMGVVKELNDEENGPQKT